MLDKEALWRGRPRDHLQQYGTPFNQGKGGYGAGVGSGDTPQRSNLGLASHMSNRSSAPPFSAVKSGAPFEGTMVPSRGGQFGDVGSRIVGGGRAAPTRHQASQSLGQGPIPPFSTNSSMTREELDRQMRMQRQLDFMSSINQQLQDRRSQQVQESLAREQAAQQRLQELDRQRMWEQSERDRKRSMLSGYRQVLDSQSGAADKQQFEVSAKKFFGVDEGSNAKEPGTDFKQSACKFYGVDEQSYQLDPINASLGRSPSRLAKTIPKTTLTDPITGAVRNIPGSRQRIHSLGNQRPVYISGKINDSPPPPSVFAEQPNFGKKVPRKVFFNPLTGERRVIGEADDPGVSRSNDGNPFRKHYENSSYYARFQEDFLK